jgi:hypothetical protein
MLFTLTDEQKLTLTLAPRTAGTSTNPDGKPARVDGVPTWTVVSGDVTLTAAEDGLSAVVIPGAANTNSVIEVTADADLGEGVTAITDTVDVAVVEASASALGLSGNVEQQ